LEEKKNHGYSDGEKVLKFLQVRRWFLLVVKNKTIQSWGNRKKKFKKGIKGTLKWWSPQVSRCLSCKNTMGKAHFQWSWHGYFSKCCVHITIQMRKKERKIHSGKWFMEYPKCGHIKTKLLLLNCQQ
jgi:hypothetical protein